MTFVLHPMRALALAVTAVLAGCAPREGTLDAAPARLADTGLWADAAARTLAPGVEPFAPQYPLWTDGAAKRRWIWLPPESAIDASDPDHWDFPAGTKLWKEFAFHGRPVETRFLHRRGDGTWLYATYRWDDAGSEASLAPADGVRGVCATEGTARHDLPSVADCRACHEGTRTPVLGFSALQLSPERDPLAPHAEPRPEGALDLDALLARSLLRGAPRGWRDSPPSVPARSAVERAALGYLHGNCASCHNAVGPLARLGLRFDVPVAATTAPALDAAVAVRSSFVRPGLSLRIAPGSPGTSVLLHRLAATDALTQMPPFGRHVADRTALDLLARWIDGLPAATDLAQTRRPERKRP